MNAVGDTIEAMIREVAAQNQLNLPLPQLKRSTALVDELGFTSWTIVELLARLEELLGVDPLEDEDVMISDVRSVGDLCSLYENYLARAAQ